MTLQQLLGIELPIIQAPMAGVQVPAADRAVFAEHLAKLGYRHWDETANPAYRLFLHAQ